MCCTQPHTVTPSTRPFEAKQDMISPKRPQREDSYIMVSQASASLPHDLFHSYIIPDILSEHLHLLLVENEAQNWHAFHTLPLVSLAFRETCRSLCITIFGLERNDDGRVIGDILTFAQSLWKRAKLSPAKAQPVLEYNYTELMSSQSLIRVYICIALARSFLNLDVLWHLVLEEGAEELVGIQRGDADADTAWGDDQNTTRLRRFRMRDDKMHRVYLPLTCAAKLCDSIRPERLAYFVAEYLAEIIPMYSTAPVMLKYSQDLESYVAREHRVDMETWVEWTRQTLGLIGDIGLLLRQMQRMGHLVNAFTINSSIPSEVIEATNIAKALHGVMVAEWGADTTEIRERTSIILHEWIPVQ